MAKKIIIWLFSLVAVFNMLINICMGLAPYTFNRELKRFKVSNYAAIYDALLGMTLIVVFPGNVIKLYKELNGVVVPNVPTIASGTTKILEYISLIMVYYLQIKNRHKFVKYINDVIMFNDRYEFNEDNTNNYSIIQHDAEFLPYIIAMFMKIILDLLIILAKITCYHYLIITPIDNYSLLIIIDLMPVVTIFFVLNVFIIGLSQSHFKFKQINKHTKILSNDVYNIKLRYQNNQIKYYEYQKKMCELSDRLDVLAICHSELCLLVRTLNKFYSIHLLLVIVLGFMDITLQLFFQYVMVSYSYLGMQNYQPKLSIVSGLIALLALCNIFNFVYSSTKLMEESRQTGQLLHYIEPTGLDIRMKRSVEIFSLQLEQNRLFIVAWRLFVVNYNIVYSIVGAATSYLIILIQFDMASSKNRFF